MRIHGRGTALAAATVCAATIGLAGSRAAQATQAGQGSFADLATWHSAAQMLTKGRHVFRHDTFGDEEFWGGRLRLHEAIAGEANGGVGPGVNPAMALAVGLKVDVDALPRQLVRQLNMGAIDLQDPATTLALLRLDSVVGLTGVFDSVDRLESVGIQCALCHSTVDDSLAPGIGQRRDGWANRDLDVGAIVALAPDLSFFANLLGTDEATVRAVLRSWGPGKFDAALALDGKAFRPDGVSGATLIPPAFGLAGVNLHTSTGWGSVTHWNGLVANLEMHGKGTFYDPRLDDADKFPIAAANGFGNVRNEVDLITSKLAALHFYQLAIPAPEPPRGSFDRGAARRGKALFPGKPIARGAMSHPSSPSLAGTCIPRARSESTISRRSGRRTSAIGPRLSRASGRIKREASTTTGVSRPCKPSSIITTASLAWASRLRKRWRSSNT